MRISTNITINENYINKSNDNLLFLKNCDIYADNKIINTRNPVLILSNKFFGHHGHFGQDVLWSFYYYFELKKKYKTVILILPDSKCDYPLIEWLKLMDITDNYILSNNISINNSNNTNIKPIFFINNLYNFEIDISESIKSDLNETIKKSPNAIHMRLWNYKDPWYHDNQFKTNINVRYNAYDKLTVVVDYIFKNLSKIKVNDKFINDKIYLSRINDNPQKWYYIDNNIEITNYLKQQNFKIISPLIKKDMYDKLFYCNNSKKIVCECSSALVYLFFAKPETEITILVSQQRAFKYNPYLKFLKKRFNNVNIVLGYNNVYKILNFNYCSFYGYKKDNLTTQVLFYFDDEEKMKSVFKDKFKLYESKKIRVFSNKEITNNSIFSAGVGGWTSLLKNSVVNNDDYNSNGILKEVNMYEYINIPNDNNKILYKDSEYIDFIKYIPGNRINNRFSVNENDFNNIIETSKNNDIDMNVFVDSVWYSTKYYIKKEELSLVI